MVGTEFINGQGLGNQLFCYVTARVVAEENGYEFGTAGQERFAVNIHSDRGMYFMDMDLGKRINQKPGKTRRFCQNIRRKALYGWFYLKKIERAVIRRMKRQNGTADA